MGFEWQENLKKQHSYVLWCINICWYVLSYGSVGKLSLEV